MLLGQVLFSSGFAWLRRTLADPWRFDMRRPKPCRQTATISMRSSRPTRSAALRVYRRAS